MWFPWKNWIELTYYRLYVFIAKIECKRLNDFRSEALTRDKGWPLKSEISKFRNNFSPQKFHSENPIILTPIDASNVFSNLLRPILKACLKC